MEYNYRFSNIGQGRLIIEYFPPVEFPQLESIRVVMPYILDSATTEDELRARAESAAPTETWEELLDEESNPVPDFSGLTSGVTRAVPLAIDLVAKSRRQRAIENEEASAAAAAAAVQPSAPAPGPVEV